MEAGEEGASGRGSGSGSGRERRRREGIKRVVLKRGDKSGTSEGADEPKYAIRFRLPVD